MLPTSANLAVTCLRYLHFDIFNQSNTNLANQQQMLSIPFVTYTAEYWGDNVHKCLDNMVIFDLVTKFLQDHQRVEVAGFLKIKATNCTALQLCAIFGLEGHLKTLLCEGADVKAKDSDGDTALTSAAIHGHDSIVKLLLNHYSIDLNPRGFKGRTPLDRAIVNDHESIVEILLEESGVDGHGKDVDGCAPLALAAEYGYDRIIEMLWLKGADVECKSAYEQTPLLLAAKYGHETVVKLLLEKHNAHIESKDLEGFTPLSLAARYNHEEVVQLLLLKGANVNTMDNHGFTPLASC